MNIIDIVKNKKQNYENYIILIKVGGFFQAYGKDSYVLSYLLGYKLKTLENDYSNCGFPVSSLEKITSNLEEKQINYIVLEKNDAEYEVTEKVDYRGSNNYEQFYKKSRLYVTLKSRIDNIYNYLNESIFDRDFKDLLSKIEDLIYDEK